MLSGSRKSCAQALHPLNLVSFGRLITNVGRRRRIQEVACELPLTDLVEFSVIILGLGP